MKPGIKKTMRVATTFTGAAACAVGFNNPAAMAATGQPAQPGHQQLRHIAANKRLSGYTTESNCANPNTSHWLHIGGRYNSVDCVGNKGLLEMSPYPNMRSFCGGNNSGYIWGHDNLHGYTVYENFHVGTYFWHLPASNKWFYVSEIGISTWHGNNKCP